MLSKIHHPVIRLHRCNFAGWSSRTWPRLVARAHRPRGADPQGRRYPTQAGQLQRGSGKPRTRPRPARHHGSHGSAPKRNTYRERYTG
ncbi:MAG: hypothetical protein ACLU37_05905 [Collinsella sp.]